MKDEDWVQWHQWQLKELERQAKKLVDIEEKVNRMCIDYTREQAEMRAELREALGLRQQIMVVGSAVGTLIVTFGYLWMKGVM